MIDPALLEELRRFLNAHKLPEYMSDLTKAVPTDLVKQIADDFRNYSPTPRADPSAKVSVQGAGRVVTGDDGPAHRPLDRSGWVEAPKVDAWRPPGVDICDQLMDEEDRRFRAQRVKEVIEANLVQRALKPAEPKEPEPEDRGDKK
jgi:hypothetical protein